MSGLFPRRSAKTIVASASSLAFQGDASSPYEGLATAFKRSLAIFIRCGSQFRSLVTAFLFGAMTIGATAEPITLVAFGDSLTAGYGVDAGDSFPERLEIALRAKGHDVTVQNAGVSGDTTAAGLARLDWALSENADGVIVALGANDALRGLPPAETAKNMEAILARIKERELPVMVAGMLAPRNMGEDYGKEFDPIFAASAKTHGAVFYPFFLEGVVTDANLNQADGIHPNRKGVDVIVGKMLATVEKLLARIE